MSLINEALKKAQRLRYEKSAPGNSEYEAAPGSRIVKRSQPQTASKLVLLVAGGLVLIVLSVVATFLLVNRPEPSPATPVARTLPAASEQPAAPTIVPEIKVPIIAVPESAPPSAQTLPVVTTPVATPLEDSPVAASSPPPAANPGAPVPVAPTPVGSPPAAALPASQGPDARISAFVEAIRVTGIRSSGIDSRVLMNDRVYRVNDIVDRTLGVRLTKVEADTLTFTDGRGITYQKNF